MSLRGGGGNTSVESLLLSPPWVPDNVLMHTLPLKTAPSNAGGLPLLDCHFLEGHDATYEG